MKCQICGAQLTKPGDICNNCMNELLEDKKYKNDDEVVYELKKKFKILHQSGFYVENAFIMIIILIGAINFSMLKIYMVFLAIMLAMFFVNMLIKKMKIESYVFKFYKTKLIYEYTFFKKESKIIKYKDIKEVTYSQTFWERIFNLGQVQIKTNSGNIFNNGIDIDCIEDVEKVFDDIKKIIAM